MWQCILLRDGRNYKRRGYLFTNVAIHDIQYDWHVHKLDAYVCQSTFLSYRIPGS